jgi:ElaB/YqjD/DUF883 family membrane-anchored ribosome-binding protein
MKAANDLDRAAALAARQAAREARECLNQQIDQLISDAEALVEGLRDVADLEIGLLRSRVEETVKATRHALASRARRTLEASDRYAHTKPWRAVGVGASAGLVIGLFIGGKHRDTLRRIAR